LKLHIVFLSVTVYRTEIATFGQMSSVGRPGIAGML
jgi:hypothetical protein